MRTNIMVGLSILLLFSIFLIQASAMTANNANVDTTLVVSNVPDNTDVLFIMNNGTPVFTKADSEGKVRYLPLIEGTLKINAIQDGKIVDNLTLNVGPKIIPQPTTPSSGGSSSGESSSGGSTGGLGVSSKESSSNVFRSETRENDLVENVSVRYYFTDSNVSVYQLLITSKVSENKVQMKVESLNGLSKLARENVPGSVYKNINIWSGSNNIKNITIRFKVENSWIEDNSIDVSDISLSKYDKDKWISLETMQIGKDNNYTYFESGTIGLPTFAISGSVKKSSQDVATPVATPTSTTAPLVVVETPEIKETETPLPTPLPTESPGFDIILAIVGICIIYAIRKTKI